MTDQTSRDREAFAEMYGREPDIDGSDWDWRGFRRGWQAALKHAQHAVESEPAHVEPEDEWMVNLAIVAHSGEPTVEAAAKLIMDWYQGAEPDRAEAVESERDKAFEEVGQALLDAGYTNAYEVAYKLMHQQAAVSERDKVPDAESLGGRDGKTE